MKIRQITDSRNQHIVAIEKDGDLRCYFKNHSIHTAGEALSSLRRDIANHGESVVNFAALPPVWVRMAKSVRRIYVVDQVGHVGRPAELENGKRVNVYLDADSLSIAAEIGDGNVSEGIRRALKAAAASGK